MKAAGAPIAAEPGPDGCLSGDPPPETDRALGGVCRVPAQVAALFPDA